MTAPTRAKPGAGRSASSFNSPMVLHADQEHGGIRIAVLLLFLLTGLTGYFALNSGLKALLPEFEYLGATTCLGGVALATFVAWFSEMRLKRIWPSGRRLIVDDRGILVRESSAEETLLEWKDNLTSLYWYFLLRGYSRGGQERRLPKLWLCLATQLQQDEKQLIVYTYMPPKQASELLEGSVGSGRFHQIFPTDVYETSLWSRFGPPSRPDIPASVLAGRDGRYWLAERRRWHHGLELTPQDFIMLTGIVQARE